MKRLILISLFCFIVYILSVTAAAELDVPAIVDIGDHHREDNISRSFNIENTGDENLTNILVSVDPSSKFKMNVNIPEFNLSIGESKSITFNVEFTEDSPIGDNLTVGTVNFQSDQNTPETVFVVSDIIGGLDIEDLDVRHTRADGRSRTDTDVKDGQTLDFDDDYDVGPGSKLEFDLGVENLFSDDDDVEIDDIKLTVTIKDIDDGDDLEEESDSFTLGTGESDDIRVFFEIPFQVEQGKYEIELKVEGDGDDGDDYKVVWDLEMDVKKDRHDLIIESASFVQDTLVCTRSTTMKVKIRNLAYRDEPNVKLEVVRSSVGINYVKEDIDLVEDPFDDENEYTANIPINVGMDVRAGTYPVDVKVSAQRIVYDSERVNLFIQDCNDGRTDEPEEEDEDEEPDEEEEEPIPEVNSFIECLDAGFNIQESYPRRCVTDTGKVFVEDIAESGPSGPVTVPVLKEQEKTVTVEKEPFPIEGIILITFGATLLIAIGLVIFVIFYLKK